MRKIILKSIILILGIMFFYACSSKNIPVITNSFQEVDSVSVSYSDSAVEVESVIENEEIKQKPKDIDSVLKANVTIEIEYQDSLVYVLGARQYYFDELGQTVAFVKLKDNNEVFAVVYPNTYDSEDQPIVIFYVLKKKEWILVSKFDSNEVNFFEIVDVNNDGVREIQSIGYPNMNGNYISNFYSFSEVENKFIDSGGFFSSIYEFKPKQSRIEVVYEGSWYMPNTKTIYYWKKDKLIPYKEVEVGYKIADMKHNAMYVNYSENLKMDKDSLQLIYKKSYRGKKLHDFYNSFFENN